MPSNKLACGKKDDCHKDECVVKCNAVVDVDLNARPKAYCHQADKNDTKFQVALKTKVNPHCEITAAKIHQSSSDPCTSICLLDVAVGFDCEATVVNDKCGKPAKRVYVDVEIPTSPDCRLVDVCHGKQRPGQGHGHGHGYDQVALEKKKPNKVAEKAGEKKIVEKAEKASASPKSFSNRQYIQALSKEEKTNKSSSQLRFH